MILGQLRIWARRTTYAALPDTAARSAQKRWRRAEGKGGKCRGKVEAGRRKRRKWKNEKSEGKGGSSTLAPHTTRNLAYSSLILTFGQIVVLSCPKTDELAKTLEEADVIADCRPEAINLYEEENSDEEDIEQTPQTGGEFRDSLNIDQFFFWKSVLFCTYEISIPCDCDNMHPLRVIGLDSESLGKAGVEVWNRE